MAGELHVAARPCPSCPYRQDVPSGVWSEAEYAKLPPFDRPADGPGSLALFHCHQENATGRPSVCVGWLGCHGYDATGVRLALADGRLTPDQVLAAADTDVALWGSGAEAAAHGMADIEDPDAEARAMVAKLQRRGAGRFEP